MKFVRVLIAIPIAAVAWACSQSQVAPTAATSSAASTAVAAEGLNLAATIEFGHPGTGSPFPPGAHDSSFHAPDTLVPASAVIDMGGTVTFNVNAPVHQVAIYAPGVGVKDINTSLLVPSCLPFLPPLIDDPANRLAVLDAQPCGGGSTSLNYTFATPGKYLVICTFLPHFAEARMYGWVTVRPRS